MKSPDMRIVGVGGPCGDVWAGRVEVLRDGQWGTICNNDNNNLRDRSKALKRNAAIAMVACREAGFAHGRFSDLNLKAQKAVPVWLDNVVCKGSEANLSSCSYTPLQGKCSHSQDFNVWRPLS